MKKICRTLNSIKGQGMVEYGLIISMIALVVIIALTPVGGVISNIFNQIVNVL